MWSKHLEDLSNAVTSTPVAKEGHLDDDIAAFEDATPPILSTTSVPPMDSQDYDSNIMAIGKDMNHLLTVIGDLKQEERRYTNHWTRAAFDELAADAETESCI